MLKRFTGSKCRVGYGGPDEQIGEGKGGEKDALLLLLKFLLLLEFHLILVVVETWVKVRALVPVTNKGVHGMRRMESRVVADHRRITSG